MLSATLKAELARLSPQDKLEVFEEIRSAVLPVPQRAFSELSADQENELLRRAKRAAERPGSGRLWSEVRQRILGR